MEFFIVFFGFMYYICRIYIETYKVSKYKYNSDINNFNLELLANKFFATPEQVSYVRSYVSENIMYLIHEFSSDLFYIYNTDFEKEPYKINAKWYYSVRKSLENLVLARDYKRIFGTYMTYKVSYIKDQAEQCIRLFERINYYVGAEECKLVQCPHKNIDDLTWSIYGSVYKPMAWNVYAKYMPSDTSKVTEVENT